MIALPPFAVLHVCMGNICRSPMAERLLMLALRRRIGDQADKYYLSHGAGTGSWHVGEPMNAPAAKQVAVRGGDPSGFSARQLNGAMIDMSELVLCATADHAARVAELRADAVPRTFVLGEFGRLLAGLDLSVLPPNGSVQDAYDRGVALVAAVDAARGGGAGWGSGGQRRQRPRRSDEVADPWGMSDREFARVADDIEQTVVPLAAALTGHSDASD